MCATDAGSLWVTGAMQDGWPSERPKVDAFRETDSLKNATHVAVKVANTLVTML